ncbi:junctional adhesion molecule A [Lithobates pipiens]
MAAMKGVWGVLLLLSLGTTVLCNTKISLKEGADAEFPCNHPTYQSPRVEWKFTSGTDTILVYYDGELTVPYKTRATFFPQGLRLSSVTRKDSGEYSCEVTGKDAGGTPQYYADKTQLVVLVPPSVPIAQVPTSVSTGCTATLYCIEKDASPLPTFTWYKNGVLMPPNPKDSPTFQNSSYTIDPTTGQLRFSPVMKTDAGQYSCQAANSEGKKLSAPVQMEVTN